ncbi:iron ABC transporter permease [Paenibacillus sp. SC116]|uniref:ABC transporter permease n=1 Tax=Paenibacillus sp. SC116 TaxID=2968986 RepID=UPI00215B2FC6|nr:iron ABC transporter permease [Paenibacillus sp. SC116]
MNKRRLFINVRNRMNAWTIVSLTGAAVILLPILYVMSGLIRPANDNWETVKQFLLTDYVIGSIKLVLFTGFFATSIGVVLAWLVVGYTFPLRKWFRWALMLPLAVPPYIAAYTYATMTSYTGFIQATLRNQFDIHVTPGTIEVMSTRGAVFILTLFLFPYVFMIAKMFLERQSAVYIENARLLGHKRLSLFFNVVLPISRPAIIAGLMLVVFEVLSDYGVANYFGVQTLSTAIFQTWFSMYDVDSAMKLAAWLMVVIIGIFVLERYLRRNQQYNTSMKQNKPLTPKPLKGAAAFGATAFCIIVFLLSFVIPVVQLVVWATWTYEKMWTADLFELTLNSLSGAAIATFIILTFALLSARTVRTMASWPAYLLTKLMTVGYAVPGAIIAIGVLAVCIQFDEWLASIYASLGMGEGVLWLSTSLFMLIAGYVIRFMATGYNAIETGYDKIPRTYSEAARTLGHGPARTFFKIELPLLKGSIVTGFILTFVEIVKELPITMLLRPFNFNTLAARTYQYAIDERIYEAALPSLLLIGISFISVLCILKIEKEKMR